MPGQTVQQFARTLAYQFNRTAGITGADIISNATDNGDGTISITTNDGGQYTLTVTTR